MKTVSDELAAFLPYAKTVYMATLYTITPLGSSDSLRLTDYSRQLVVAGKTFLPADVTRDRLRLVLGLEVDTCGVQIVEGANTDVAGVGIYKAACLGALDGAYVLIERLVMREPGDTSLGALHLFAGRVSEVSISRTGIALPVKSELERLDALIPRILHQSGCHHTLYDSQCSVSKAAHAYQTSVTSVTGLSTVTVATPSAEGWYSLGVLQYTSGPDIGKRRSILSHTAGGVMSLAGAAADNPAVGVSVTIWPGCDRTPGTCTSKFNNKQNFLGFPHVPTPEAII